MILDIRCWILDFWNIGFPLPAIGWHFPIIQFFQLPSIILLSEGDFISSHSLSAQCPFSQYPGHKIAFLTLGFCLPTSIFRPFITSFLPCQTSYTSYLITLSKIGLKPKDKVLHLLFEMIPQIYFSNSLRWISVITFALPQTANTIWTYIWV